MSNIYEIADKTGFSPSTVSRALSGKGSVGQETKKRILATAESMHYTPNHSARSLRIQRTYKILMCVPDLYNPFYFNLIKGASDVLESHGYYIMLSHSKRILQEELKIINMLKERYGDGMMFLTFDLNETNIQALTDTHMPVVTTNRIPNDSRIDYVHVDQTKAMYLATCHLIEMGHTEIGVLIGDIKEQNSYERYEGFARAMNEHGLPICEDRVIASDFTREHTRVEMNRYFAAHKESAMTAIVAANTLMGIGCMDACGENGIDIPNDLSLISLDDTDVATCTSPRLSVIDMRQEEIGKKAALLLLEQIEGRVGRRKTVLVEPKLIVRDSVKRL